MCVDRALQPQAVAFRSRRQQASVAVWSSGVATSASARHSPAVYDAIRALPFDGSANANRGRFDRSRHDGRGRFA